MGRSFKQWQASSTLAQLISDEGSKAEILSRIAQTTAALTRLKPVWKDRSTFLSSKTRLMYSTCNIHLPVCLWIMDPYSRAAKKNTSHGSEVQDTARVTQRLCYKWRSLCQDPAGSLATRRLLTSWPSHSSGLAKIIMQGTAKGRRRQGRQKKRWGGNIRKWTCLEFTKFQRAVESREEWRKLGVKSSVVPQRPSRLRDRWRWRIFDGTNACTAGPLSYTSIGGYLSPQQSERCAFISVARCVALTWSRVPRSSEPKANRRVRTGLRSYERSYEGMRRHSKARYEKARYDNICNCFVLETPRGFTFKWWGCYGFCQRNRPIELAHSFLFCSCVYFCLFGPFNCISFHKSSDNSPFSHSVFPVLSLPYLSFQLNSSLWKSPSALI